MAVARAPFNIVLIGYRGTGKTSVGQILAKELKFDFVDCDVLAVKQCGMSIDAYVAANGWPAFRSMETQILQDRIWRAKTVVATGGGAVLRDYARFMFQRHPFVVWLTASVDNIVERVRNDESSRGMRPALGHYKSLAHEVKATLNEREPLYAGSAGLVVDTDWRTPSEAAEEIMQAWHLKQNNL